MKYFSVRADGAYAIGDGPDGWMDCGLRHADVCNGSDCADRAVHAFPETNPLRAFGCQLENGPQLVIQLRPGERLQHKRRVPVPFGPHEAPPPCELFGIVRSDNTGVYLFVLNDGSLTLSSDFEAAQHG